MYRAGDYSRAKNSGWRASDFVGNQKINEMKHSLWRAWDVYLLCRRCQSSHRNLQSIIEIEEVLSTPDWACIMAWLGAAYLANGEITSARKLHFMR